MHNQDDKYLLCLEKQNIECSDVEEFYMDLIEHDLPLSVAGRLEEHVEQCANCQKEIAETELIVKLAKDCFNVPPLPEGVRQRLHDRLNEELGLNLS